MLEIKESFANSKNGPKVMVIGIGGGGNNAVTRMIEKASDFVTYAALNTDSMTLDKCPATKRLQLGAKLTQGYGAGGDPTIGESAAKARKISQIWSMTPTWSFSPAEWAAAQVPVPFQ